MRRRTGRLRSSSSCKLRNYVIGFLVFYIPIKSFFASIFVFITNNQILFEEDPFSLCSVVFGEVGAMALGGAIVVSISNICTPVLQLNFMSSLSPLFTIFSHDVPRYYTLKNKENTTQINA